MKQPLNLPKQFECTWIDDRVHMKPPIRFCIYENENFNRTIGFLTWVGNFTYSQNVKVHIDFSSIEYIGAAASVMLFAEITRAQLNGDPDVVTLTLPKEIRALNNFKKTGLYKAIMPGGYRKLVSLFDNNNLYQSGTEPDKFTISTLLSVTQQGVNFAKPETKWFTRGIQEAMLNVIHHAYEDFEDPFSGIGRRWWQCSYFDRESKLLIFIIYDKGKGIPSSINKVAPPNFHQGKKIEFMMKKGVTRYTNLPNRGKGSDDILQLAEMKDNSKLFVCSGKGLYYLDKENGNIVCEEKKLDINGTLVEWHIPYE